MPRLRERIPGRDSSPGAGRRYRPIQPTALILGVLFLLIGVLGFIPGVTSEVGSLGLFRSGSGPALFHYFAVSATQNLIHLVFGLLFIAVAARARIAHWTLLGSGIFFLLFYCYGIFAGQGRDENYLSLNMPSNWLHLGMAVVLISVAVLAGRNKYPAHSGSPPSSHPFTDT